MPENTTPPASPVPPKAAPLNPQMETVLMNQPKPQKNSTFPPSGSPSNIPPKKIGREKDIASRRKFLLGCLGGFIFLFLIFIVLMVLMIGRSGASNPIIAQFGLDSNGIRAFLQGIIGFTFGAFSLLFLVLTILGVFRFLGAQKTDKEKRQHNARLSLFSSAALVFLIFIWVLLAGYISRIELNLVTVNAEILVLDPPDLTNLQAPVEIKFSAENVARALEQSGVNIEAMNWDLDGDGKFETPVKGAEITKIYNQNGTYNVGLQVKVQGEDTFRDPYIKSIVIQTAMFEAEPATGTPPVEIQFDASNIVNEDQIKSLDWDFDGDGKFDLEGPDNLTPRYTFKQIGTYNVLLRAIDQNGTLQRYTRKVEITASETPLLSARIQATPSLKGTVPLQVRFDGGDSTSLKGKVTQYEWDFGDGSDLQSGRSVSHLFEKPGFYQVALKIQDDLGNQDQAIVEVEAQGISSAPQAIIKTTPAIGIDDETLTGTLPFAVDFDASKSLDSDNDIVDYQWDFDADGKIDAQGAKVKQVFEEAGKFQVTLNVIDAKDQKSTALFIVTVQEPAVQARIQATPEEGSAPLVVQFDGSSSTTFKGNITSYEWDFGDGSKTTTSAQVSHKYMSVGTYEVKLKVLTNNNESATMTKQIFVREMPLKSCFTPSRTTGAAPLIVSFNSKCASGQIKKYQWDYGDGEQSSSASPTHTFEQPGSYQVQLEISDDKNNVSQSQQTIEVQ